MPIERGIHHLRSGSEVVGETVHGAALVQDFGHSLARPGQPATLPLALLALLPPHALFRPLALAPPFSIFHHTFINNSNAMDRQGNSLNPSHFRNEVRQLTRAHQQQIAQANENLKRKFLSNKTTETHKKSVQADSPLYPPQQRRSILYSDLSNSPEPETQIPISQAPPSPKPYELREWMPAREGGFPDLSALVGYYSEVFERKKLPRGNRKHSYDFKQDEKELLVRIFEEIKSEQNNVSFQNVTAFFEKCPLFYLFYNIRPKQLSDVLKDFAHQSQDKLTLLEFLNLFYIDRPNVATFHDTQQHFVNKRCVLTAENWKELKTIFSTLDTFGNEVIHFTPFLYKVKNNHSNLQLINEPAIEYPEIRRTIPIKKVIFNIEYRQMPEKIRWVDIEQLFTNFTCPQQPTIDAIYQSMIQKGQIGKSSNYFMLHPDLLCEIKRIYQRCPKYCDQFVKTQSVTREMLESPFIKPRMKDAVVRVLRKGTHSHHLTLEDQIRALTTEAEDYIDLDELLEHFSIKGPINTTAQTLEEGSSSSSSDSEDQLRLRELSKAKSLGRARQYSSQGRGHKFIRHLTMCTEFNLTKKAGETIMERKTREMREQKQQQERSQLGKKFKASPIPVELNHERYNEYLKKLQEQKQLKKQQFLKKREEDNKIYQYLKSNTALFEKRGPTAAPQRTNAQFISNPVPWFVTEVYMLDKINEGKDLRKRKLQADAKLKMLKQWKRLPDAMKQYSQPSLQGQEHPEPQHHIQLPQKHSKAKEVPDFQQLHSEFQAELQKRKQTFKSTQPIQFNLSSPKPKKPSEWQLAHAQPQSHSRPHLNLKTSSQICLAKDRAQIPTTVKYQQMVNFTHQKLNSQLKQMQQALTEQQNRVEKQQNFAKYMRSKLKQSLRKSCSLQELVKAKSRHLRQGWKQLQRENEEDLCRMYSNVMNRPFLFESQDAFQPGKHAAQSKPLKKKHRRNAERGKHKSPKHIHQSPLKEFEAEPFDSEKKLSPALEQFQSEQEFAPHLNQSF